MRFIVDDMVVKTVEVRRHDRLDAYDYPPDPKKEGFYFLEWRCEGEESSAENHDFDEDCDVYAVFLPDEEVTRPKGLFFAFDDVWVDSHVTLMSTGVVIMPSDVIDRHLTWTSSDPSVADVLPSGFVKVRKVGEAVLTCTSSNGLTVSYTLHVYDPNETKPRDFESFELESDRLELKVGQYGQVKVDLFPQSDPEPIGPSTAVYLCTSGDNGTWPKGSGDSLGFKFERSENNHLTFAHFTGILVDGMSVDESSYTAKRGSLVLELSPSFLEDLPTGKHVVTALFDDGNAQASFVVSNKKDGSAVGPSDDKKDDVVRASPTASTPKTSASVPQTGDDTPISVMMALCVCSLALIAASVRARRRG